MASRTSTRAPLGAKLIRGPEGERRRLLAPERLPVVVLALASIAWVFVLLYLGRNRIFHYDEWNFVVDRTAGGRFGGLDLFLEPHNEHLVAIPAALYRICFELFGLSTTVPERLLVALAHAACAVLVFVFARRRVGDWPALVLAVAVLALGAGYENMLWGFQVGFAASAAFGVGALVAFDRGTRGGDIAASVLLLGSLLSPGAFVPFVICIGVELLMTRRWTRLWVLGVPVALYGLWYLGYSPDRLSSSLVDAFPWAVDAASSAAGALIGDSANKYGSIALLAVVAAVVWRLRRVLPVTPRLYGLLAGTAAFWLLLGMSRAGVTTANSSRYLHIGAILLALILAEVGAVRVFTRRETVMLAVVAAIGIACGLDDLRNGTRGYRSSSDEVGAALGTVELLGPDVVPPDLRPDPQRAPQLVARAYFSAVERAGSSPAKTPAEIETAASTSRQLSDRVIVATGALAPAPAGSRPPAGTSTCQDPQSGTFEVTSQPGAHLHLSVDRRADGSAEVRFRRFFEGYDQVIATVTAEQPIVIRPPADVAAESSPYRFQITSPVPVTVCEIPQ